MSLVAPLTLLAGCFAALGQPFDFFGVRNTLASGRWCSPRIPCLSRHRKSCTVCFHFRTNGDLSHPPKCFAIMPLKICATKVKTSVTFLLCNGGPKIFCPAPVGLACACITPINRSDVRRRCPGEISRGAGPIMASGVYRGAILDPPPWRSDAR
jgi:hypothetical protein